MNHVLRIAKGRTVEPYMRIGKTVVAVMLILMVVH